MIALGQDKCFALKENKMIKSFKCAGMTLERVRKMREALKVRVPRLQSFLACADVHAAFVYFRSDDNSFGFDPSLMADIFIESPFLEMTFGQAMEMILSVPIPKPTPAFTFKPFDKVLRRHSRTDTWSLGFFSHAGPDAFVGLNNAKLTCMVPYEGNESLLNTTKQPDGWWEVREGEPVWRFK